jgi:heme O synthase-like polyprenyltransferase
MKAQIIIGAIFAVIGVSLLLINHIVGTIYGIITLLIGVGLIVFRNEEDKIEKRKDKK